MRRFKHLRDGQICEYPRNPSMFSGLSQVGGSVHQFSSANHWHANTDEALIHMDLDVEMDHQ